LIVAQAFVTEVLCKFSAMCNRLGIRFEFNSDSISQWNAVFHIEEKHLHCITSVAPIRRVSIRSEVKRAMTPRRLPACGSAAIATQGYGDLPMLVPLIASGKAPPPRLSLTAGDLCLPMQPMSCSSIV
jgi:hypothetical protein